MKTAETLLLQLKQLGEDIARIIRNFSKDSSSRKTSSYYQERLTRLNEAWTEFEEKDSELRELKDVNKADEYFTADFYNQIKEMALKYISRMEGELEQQRQVIDPKEPTEGHNRAPLQGDDPQAAGGHDGLISRAIGKMAALTRQLDGLSRPLQPGQEQSYYEVKGATITQLWQQLEQLNDEVLDKYPHPELAGYDSGRYVRLEHEAQSALIHLATAKRNQHPTPPAGNMTRSSTLPLPTITITKFDGDYMRWTSFSDLFNRIVHEQQMSDAHKMWYLKTNVVGEAANVINHLAVTEENYQSAWKLLQDRYNNKRVIVATTLQRLLDQPSGAYTLSAIKRLHDTTKECMASLANMGLTTTSWDPLLIHLLVKKVDKTVHTQYEQSISNPKEIQSLDHFLCFLENYFHTLEAMGQKEKASVPNYKTCALAAQPRQASQRCISCKQDSHPLYRCKEFLLTNSASRLNLVQKHKLCVNCFNNKHTTQQCTALGRCQKCKKKHHTLVHLEPSSKGSLNFSKGTNTADNATGSSKEESTNHQSRIHATSLIATPKEKVKGVTTIPVKHRPYVLLGTALVKVKANGLELECKAILDSGSQVNLITERVVRQLGLSAKSTAISINGVGRNRTKVQHRVNITLQSRINNFSTRLEAFVLPQIIAPQPAQLLHIDKWSIPNNVTLADPTFNCPDKVDILLGAEYYHQLISIGQIKLADDLPVLQNTTFGWIVSGKVSSEQLAAATCGVCTEDDTMTTAIERFWELEEIKSTQQQLSPYDAQCETHFNQNTIRNKEGRFIVRLPFCKEPSALGDSHGITFHRFLTLERRLAKDSSIKEQYIQFMEEYENLGHMTKINIHEVKGSKYFIPHHHVLRPESSTTKLRVVFDASAKTSSGISLNDILHTGPPLQNELFTILLRFRIPRFVFTTDIEKMYRQIRIHPDDRQCQIILWRKNTTEPISYFTLNTVTYGTRPAPYLAIRCLKEISHDVKTRFPLAATFLNQNFYVDDGLGGADSLSTAIETQRQLQHVVSMYGLKLRKWCANHPQLLSNIPDHDKEVSLDFSTEETNYTKTLGLAWLPKGDLLKIKVNVQPIKAVTKRTVTSDLARIFDPLGLLSPVVVRAKMFIQELWTLNLAWDEAVPAEFDTRWRNFRNNLSELENVHVHRHIYKGEVTYNTQLHVFSDASEKAYGAAIYVRTLLSNKTIIVHLLCAKSRIAPLKQQTLPRLELCAAQLGASLAAKVKGELDMNTTPTFYWSDSSIVLTWINSRSSSFHTFVANRIASIHETTTPEQWRHVSSKDNPADIISRGLDPQQLLQLPHWLYGPFFLHGTEVNWPPVLVLNSDDVTTERKQIPHNLIITIQAENPLHSINHRNSFKTLQRVIGYVFRFIKNSKSKKAERQLRRTLTPVELHDSRLIIVRIIQQCTFKEDIQHLRKHKELKGSSSITSLTPFLDENNILRVGGRLDASPLSFDAKHPMLLPYDDIIVRILFDSIHKENKHCGAQTLLAIVRQRFWPIKGKHLARETVHKCVTCTRSKPKLLQQIMGNLPQPRVTPARPFINAGVDYCGPIWVHFKTRGKRPQKAYIAVFCCFATKAVHLELVTDLTTDAFIGALKRFISRRGHCQHLYCDNATNFVGAKNQLTELSAAVFAQNAQETIQQECASKNINFHFIPPRAPHFGGLWEAAVKSAKRLLVKETANASLTYEEMETVIIEVEAILNSRPIAPLSGDPNDEGALTPGHFLIGEPLTAQVDATAQSTSTPLARRWELVSRVKHQFWTRWSQEYLNELQQRNKWKTISPNLQVGTLVIIKDTSPVMAWRLGKVIETYPGPDGIVRTAAIKTSNGIIKRAIHLLAPLPVDIPITNVDNGMPDNSTPLKRSTSSNDKIKTTPPRKCSKLATLSLMVLVTLFWSPVLCHVNYTKITSNPGLHFEQIGLVKPIISDWKLLIYFELAPFRNELQQLINGVTMLTKVCKDPNVSYHCQGLIAHFNKLDRNIEANLDNLARRKKRGAVDVVGNVANSLFGVLDSKYAEKMTETINSLKTNEAHLNKLLRNQTSFLDSTLNLMKQNTAEMNSNVENLSFRITRLENLTKGDTNQRMQLILALSIQLVITAENLQKMLSSMTTLMADTYHGRISPTLLTPQQFAAEVDNIKANLPTHLNLPVTDIIHLYGIVTAHAAISDQHIICTLFIPLAHQNEYDLFYITPVPQLINTSLVAIMPTTKLIALNAHRDECIPITETKLLDCNTIEHDIFLCPNMQTTYSKGASICRCEIHLFNNESDSSCNIELIANDNVWYQLYRKNQWLFSTQHQLKLSTVCNGDSSYQMLQGTGLLTLPAGCTMKNEVLTIYGHQTITSVMHPSYTSNGISVPHLQQNMNNLTQTLPYILRIENITRLQADVQAQLRDLPPSPSHHEVHGLVVSYGGLALVVAVILILFRRRFMSTRTNPEPASPAPQPLPRSNWDISLESLP